VKSIVDNQIAALNNSSRKFKDKFEKKGIDLEQITTRVTSTMEEYFTNKDFLSDLFLEGFLDESENKHLVDHLVESLSAKKFFVFKTTSENSFITNDNPGCSMIKGDKIRNTSFNNNWEAFLIPIDPLSLLVVLENEEEKDISVFKDIHYRKANLDFVELTNKASVANCNEAIFSDNKELLNRLNENYHEYFIGDEFK